MEIILAERRVAWAEDITDFEVRLEKVSVSVLYAVILKKLREKFDVEQGGASMAGRDFVEVIEGEIDHLESIGHWPEDVPSVSDIL